MENIDKVEYSELAYASMLNSLSALCRREADKWYHDPRTGEMIFLNHGERFMLMVSEI